MAQRPLVTTCFHTSLCAAIRRRTRDSITARQFWLAVLCNLACGFAVPHVWINHVLLEHLLTFDRLHTAAALRPSPPCPDQTQRSAHRTNSTNKRLRQQSRFQCFWTSFASPWPCEDRLPCFGHVSRAHCPAKIGSHVFVWTSFASPWPNECWSTCFRA